MSIATEDHAQAGFWARRLPIDESWESIATSQEFGPFAAGDWVIISCDAPAHVNAGAAGGSATAAHPQLPAGMHDFIIPDGATHVHLFGAGSGNASCWGG